MTGRDPSRSFREQAEGVSSGPQYENAEEHWLLEVATGSDWNGSKQARASTSCGSIFIGGNWIYSYSRMQKCVTLSSTEAEYIALVSGGSEGLLVKAVLQHLTRETVDLKVYSDNTSCVAVAQKALAASNILMAGCFGCNNAKEEIWSCDAWTRSPTLQIWAQKALPGRRVRFLLYRLDFPTFGVIWAYRRCEKRRPRRTQRIESEQSKQ
jgi:hypothetical protein